MQIIENSDGTIKEIIDGMKKRLSQLWKLKAAKKKEISEINSEIRFLTRYLASKGVIEKITPRHSQGALSKAGNGGH